MLPDSISTGPGTGRDRACTMAVRQHSYEVLRGVQKEGICGGGYVNTLQNMPCGPSAVFPQHSSCSSLRTPITYPMCCDSGLGLSSTHLTLPSQ